MLQRGDPLAGELYHQRGCGCGYAGHDVDIDCVRPAIFRQMEQRIAADQGDVASASAVDVTRFAAGHESLGSDYFRRLTGAAECKLGQLAQVVARRLQA